MNGTWVSVMTGIVGCLTLIGVTVGTQHFMSTHGLRLSVEKTRGNQKIRRTFAGQIGRGHQPDQKGGVYRAEHMRGWVAIVVSRFPGHGEQHHVEWALTRRSAQRKLDRHLRGPRRTERGAGSIATLLIGCAVILVGLMWVAVASPDLANRVFKADVVAWLQHTGHHWWHVVRHWLSGIFQ